MNNYCFDNNKNSYRNSKGATMIMAIIIMTILIVFTFSLTLIAYTLYASQNKNIASVKCAEAANSLSMAISEELTYESIDSESDDNSVYPEKSSYLYRYLRYNICQDDKTWPYYVSDSTEGHDQAAAFRYFYIIPVKNKKATVTRANGDVEQGVSFDYVEGMPGKVEVCIYWMLPKGIEVPSDSTAKESLSSSRNGIRLFVKITCESANESYTVTKEYELDSESKYPDGDKRYEKIELAGQDGNINPLGLSYLNDIFGREKWIWEATDKEM